MEYIILIFCGLFAFWMHITASSRNNKIINNLREYEKKEAGKLKSKV